MPTPYRGRGAAAVALNATCVGCHAEQAEAWRTSMHRRAYDNPAFQVGLAAEPTAFCRGCHAPEANAELGVACVTCHVTAEGTVLAGPASGTAASGSPTTSALAGPASRSPASGSPTSAPHALARRAEFAGAAGCAGCHEFPFPGAPSRDERHLMQTTLLEHARVGAEARCTSCHASHAFSEVRDPAWLSSRLRVRAEIVRSATPSTTARITLEQTAPGHAFPTGDLFRRLAVRVGPETSYLARHFEGRRVLTRDDRVFDEPRVVELPIAAGASEVAWSVTLERVAAVGAGSEPARATIESAVLLHSGVLAVHASSARSTASSRGSSAGMPFCQSAL